MNGLVIPAAPSGIPPGLPAALAAAVLWFMAKLAGLASWRLRCAAMTRDRMTGRPHTISSIEVQNYLHRGAHRFARVMARLAAGETFRPSPSRAGQTRAARARPRLRMPMTYGWIGRLGEDVRMTGAIIGYHLNRTEVSAMIAACPQAQRVMRPICHVIGIDAPCVGRVVRRKKVRTRVVEAPVPHPGSPSRHAPAGEGLRVATGETAAPPSAQPWSASQPKPANAGEGDGSGMPMKAAPRKRPDD